MFGRHPGLIASVSIYLVPIAGRFPVAGSRSSHPPRTSCTGVVHVGRRHIHGPRQHADHHIRAQHVHSVWIGMMIIGVDAISPHLIPGSATRTLEISPEREQFVVVAIDLKVIIEISVT